MLTLAYMTARKEPQFHWWADSYNRECKGNYENTKIVVVDFYAEEPGRKDWLAKQAHCDITHVPPKPCVWQGKHRLTSVDYFAAASARNTAVCLAPDGWIVFCDDLSVLMPGWRDAVLEAMNKGYIVCGAYKKVMALVVEKGEAVYYREYKAGLDTRYAVGLADRAVPLGGGGMYGCSVGMPVEAILQVGGWPEPADCCGMGSEDYLCGMVLEQRGWKIMYDIRMLTLESEERHHWQKPMKRVIEKKEGDPQDASWAILNPVMAGKVTRFENYFDEGGIERLRQRVLAGEPFPIMQHPQHSWYSGKPLSEL